MIRVGQVVGGGQMVGGGQVTGGRVVGMGHVVGGQVIEGQGGDGGGQSAIHNNNNWTVKLLWSYQ